MNSYDVQSKTYNISSSVDVDIAVLETPRLDMAQCFAPPERVLLATVVAELARNIVKYAQRGRVSLISARHDGVNGIEIVAEDCGPGIHDVERAMQDHVSSGGTLGLGLPGVRRMMDDFEIESEPGRGTRVSARKWVKKKR